VPKWLPKAGPFQRIFGHFASQRPPRTLLEQVRVANSISYRFGTDFGTEIYDFCMNWRAVCGSVSVTIQDPIQFNM
jgi:hypothetical protein